MGPYTMCVANNGFACKGIAYDGIRPLTVGITGNESADNMSTDDTAPDDTADPDDGHRQQWPCR